MLVAPQHACLFKKGNTNTYFSGYGLICKYSVKIRVTRKIKNVKKIKSDPINNYILTCDHARIRSDLSPRK